jgi:hypothetical protein
VLSRKACDKLLFGLRQIRADTFLEAADLLRARARELATAKKGKR